MKFIKNIYHIYFIILFILTGCATNYGSVSSSEVSNAIVVTNSTFDSAATYTGPQILSETRRGLFTDNEIVRLIASRDKKTEKIYYAIYVQIIYPIEWRFYRSVSFANGAQQDLRSLSQKAQACSGIGCVLTEEVIFNIEKNMIVSGDSFEFRLNSKTGRQNIIKIPRSYIDGFFNGLPPEFSR